MTGWLSGSSGPSEPPAREPMAEVRAGWRGDERAVILTIWVPGAMTPESVGLPVDAARALQAKLAIAIADVAGESQ